MRAGGSDMRVSERVIGKIDQDDEGRKRRKSLFDLIKKSEIQQKEDWKKLVSLPDTKKPVFVPDGKKPVSVLGRKKPVFVPGSKKPVSVPGRKKLEERAAWNSGKLVSPKNYAIASRLKREMDLKKKQWPRIFVNELGKRSSLSVGGERTPLCMGDVQSLLLVSAAGNRSSVTPKWCSLKGFGQVSHIVMIHIEGVGLNDVQHSTHTPLQGSDSPCDATNNRKEEVMDYQEGNCDVDKESGITKRTGLSQGNTEIGVSSSGGLPGWLNTSLPRTGHLMHHSLELVAPSIHGGFPVEELLQLKREPIQACNKRTVEEDLERHEKETMNNKRMKPGDSFLKFLPVTSSSTEGKLHPNDKFSRIKLLLKAEDFAQNRFPLPLSGYKACRNAKFVFTSDTYKEVTPCSPMFGLDCEMCLTSIQKLELTSISVVNEQLKVVYHSLVLPYNPVVNFLTKYSGITRNMLQKVTKRLEDVQQDLRELLPPDAILVGHSLESDLGALKMMHPYVIDSSVAYNLSGLRYKRTSLKELSELFLGERIQTAWEEGHDPTEDACASLKLIQLKLRHDEAYGNVMLGWQPPSASLHSWQECQPNGWENQKQKVTKHSKGDIKEDPCLQIGKAPPNGSIGPFNRENGHIFQKIEPCSISIITTTLCLSKFMDVFASLTTMPSVEVLSGNKQVSQQACALGTSSHLTYVHMEMGKKLSQCPDEATRQKQLTKLDKRLRRIHKAAAPKSIHIYVFSGSSYRVPLSQRSNGFVLVGIKDLPYRT